MKNKVLATLLAVCLFAGLAVPAFAEYSSQSGLDEDIKTMEFVKKEYTVKNGGDPVDLSNEIRAYASTKQLVQEPNIVWSIENDDKYAFGISDNGSVTASEDAGTATVIATAVDGKVIAKTTVKAAKNVVLNATGFQFESTTKALKYGIELIGLGKTDDQADYKDQTIDIVATPKDAVFTAAQLDAVFASASNAVSAGNFDITDGTNTVRPTVDKKSNKVVLVYATGAVASTKVATATHTAVAAGSAGKISFADVTVDVAAGDDDEAVAAKIRTAINANSSKWMAVTVAAPSATVGLIAKKGNYGVVQADVPAAKPVVTGTASGYSAGVAITVTVTNVVGGVAGTGTMAGLNATKIDAKRCEFKVEFPNANEKITSKPEIKKSISISGVVANTVTSINAAGTITVEVGEKKSTASMFKQTPSKGNLTFTVGYANDYVDGNAQNADYAVLTGTNADDASEVIGVAVGTNRLVGTITDINGKTSSASIVIKVVEKGTKPSEGGNTTVLSAWAPKLGVGETANIVVKADGDVTYKSLNEAVATVDAAGKITAVKEGVAKISVQEEGKDMVYLTVTVGATTTKPEDKPTDVPQTAVAALVALF